MDLHEHKKEKQKRTAVFLDRDGVLNQEPPHYAHRPDQLRLIPRAAEAVKVLNDRNFLTIVVTNQAGIARGYYEERDMHVFHESMQSILRENNAAIDAFYFCPHHPDAKIEKYRMLCSCRKPASGMFFDAARDFQIDLGTSFIVGDKWSDMEAGKNAGCRTIFVRTGHEAEAMEKSGKSLYDYIAKDLYDAVEYIISFDDPA